MHNNTTKTIHNAVGDLKKIKQEQQIKLNSHIQHLMRSAFRAYGSINLYIGLGKTYYDGWINIDNSTDNHREKLHLSWNLKDKLPFPDNSVDYIFNENIFQRLDVEESKNLLKDFLRILKPSGVLRIATINLDEVIKNFSNPNFESVHSNILIKSGLGFVKTRAEYINVFFKQENYTWLYNYEELERRLKDAGFMTINQEEIYHSTYDTLKYLEMCHESSLIVEAHKKIPNEIICEKITKNTLVKQERKPKIHCLVFAFYNFENTKRSLESILEKSEYLSITIIENHSKYSETKFKPYFLDLIDKKIIDKYILFNGNSIENIRYATYNEMILAGKNNFQYTMLTDSDLIFENDWLEEELTILQENEHVFVVSNDLYLHNLPSLPNAENWLSPGSYVYKKNYLEGPSGAWAMLFRTAELMEMLTCFHEKNIAYVDYMICHYAYMNNKVTARTKRNRAYHITWDNYQNNDEYMQFRATMNNEEKWAETTLFDYTEYTYGNAKKITPLK